MSIPDYQTLMLPLLEAVSDGHRHQISNLYTLLSDRFGLTEEDRNARLPSGRETYIKNRVSWARTYLKKAGLVSSPAKGIVQITTVGQELLARKPDRVNNVLLREYPSFVKFRPRESDRMQEETAQDDGITQVTPLESFESSYKSLRDELASELLDTIKQSNPYFFERLVIDLMLAMGYGGSRHDAGEATQMGGDGGIDGVIREDPLGLNTIFLQAKRYTSEIVGVRSLRDFAGALQGMRSKKGVFITTSAYSSDAEKYVDRIDSTIILIDGQKLSQLMIDHNIGVSLKDSFEIKQIDTDYFSDD